MPDIRTRTESETRTEAQFTRPNRLDRLIAAILDAIIEGFAAYGMAHACPGLGLESDAPPARPEGGTDRPFEQTMAELRALAHAASLPGYVSPRSSRPDL